MKRETLMGGYAGVFGSTTGNSGAGRERVGVGYSNWGSVVMKSTRQVEAAKAIGE